MSGFWVLRTQVNSWALADPDANGPSETFCSSGDRERALTTHLCLDFAGAERQILASTNGKSGGAVDQRIVIAQLNINHYRRKLAIEKDEATRQTIVRLLAEEEAKLAVLKDPPGEKRRRTTSVSAIRASASGGPRSASLFPH
jgi:hypothetical protein